MADPLLGNALNNLQDQSSFTFRGTGVDSEVVKILQVTTKRKDDICMKEYHVRNLFRKQTSLL